MALSEIRGPATVTGHDGNSIVDILYSQPEYYFDLGMYLVDVR